MPQVAPLHAFPTTHRLCGQLLPPAVLSLSLSLSITPLSSTHTHTPDGAPFYLAHLERVIVALGETREQQLVGVLAPLGGSWFSGLATRSQLHAGGGLQQLRWQ